MKMFIALFSVIISINSFATSKKYFEEEIHYRTMFGSCPSKIVGRLALTLMKEFEKKKSLLDIKKKIIDEKLEDKYFLASYKVDYNPLHKMIKFQFDCPKPLMKVQIYKNDGEEFYTAILVDNGKLFDPTYEVLLRSEKILTGQLPRMAIPANLINSEIHMRLTSLFNKLGTGFVKNISEVILNESEELTIILSIGRKPSSAFLGKEFWKEKVLKLNEIVKHMANKKTIPAVINLTNSKKVVVKFSESI